FDDNGVITGELELCGEKAAGLGISNSAGEGRLGDGCQPGLARNRRSGERAKGKDKHVLRTKGIRSDRRVLLQIIGAQGAPTHVAAIVGFFRLFYLDRAVCQVDVQNFSVVTARHRVRLSIGWYCPLALAIIAAGSSRST